MFCQKTSNGRQIYELGTHIYADKNLHENTDF